jgi:hypothetical protein
MDAISGLTGRRMTLGDLLKSITTPISGKTLRILMQAAG